MKRLNPSGGFPPNIRKLAKQRDSYTCQNCGATGIPLEVDHINNNRGPGYDDIENAQTLCRPCHERKTRRETRVGHRRRIMVAYHPGERHPGLID